MFEFCCGHVVSLHASRLMIGNSTRKVGDLSVNYRRIVSRCNQSSAERETAEPSQCRLTVQSLWCWLEWRERPHWPVISRWSGTPAPRGVVGPLIQITADPQQQLQQERERDCLSQTWQALPCRASVSLTDARLPASVVHSTSQHRPSPAQSVHSADLLHSTSSLLWRLDLQWRSANPYRWRQHVCLSCSVLGLCAHTLNLLCIVTKEMIWRAYMIKELVMVRDGVCSLSSDEFFRDDVLALIFNLSVSWFFLFLHLLYCVCVYFEYDLQ